MKEVNLRSVRLNSYDRAQVRLQAELDVALRRLHQNARLLIGATTHSDPTERQRLVKAVEQDQHAKPNWVWESVPVDSSLWKELSRARQLAEHSVASGLYLPRLEEIETELLLLESLGQSKAVRPMAARLYGTGAEPAFGDVDFTVLDVAHEILANTTDDEEPRVVPASSAHSHNLKDTMLAYARAVGLHIAVRIDPGLIANAAVGERTVFIADRLFGAREAQRLAVHEVYGHLVSGFNGRTQLFGVFSVGTAGSYAAQEGVAIFLEERAGLLDGARKRMLAARLLVTNAMHSGVSFGDAARLIVREHGFSPSQAVALCERAFRGGGVARDAVYLSSWLKVRRAVHQGDVTLPELQVGKVSLDVMEDIRALVERGVVSDPVYLSTLASNFGKTGSGTRSATSPPSLATSLTRFDAT